MGGNRDAAAYSGINVKRVETMTYVISAGLAGVAGVCYAAYIGQMSQQVGIAYELYAIAGAVLGGCSLRGGEGTILGVLIGAAVMQVLRTAITFVTDYQYIELLIIGVVLLCGVIVDELVKRYAARRRAVRQAG